jgi:hypothetical protein
MGFLMAGAPGMRYAPFICRGVGYALLCNDKKVA